MNPPRQRRRTDRLFGQIAVELGILTTKQLDKALEVQSASEPPRPLGLVLMDLRLVTRDDLDKILEAQRKIAERQHERGKERHDDNLFGKVAVKLGFLTPAQLTECLDIQKRAGPESTLRLGDLMARRGLADPEQVRRILEVQSGLAVPCPACAVLHNVLMFMPLSTIPCRSCQATITVPPR